MIQNYFVMLIEIRYKQQWTVLRKWGSIIGNDQDLGVIILGGLQEISYRVYYSLGVRKITVRKK